VVWAIGDLQGCYDSFMRLLEKIEFNPKKDQLWLVGDLVNRGSGSREVIEYLYAHRKSIRAVLGNHDIALLAAWWGIKRSNPAIDPLLKDPMAKKWMKWLRSLPFVYVDRKLGYVMAHAGIPPAFDLKSSLRYSATLQKRLQGGNASQWLAEMMDGSTDRFDPSGTESEQERYALSGFTRMRYCRADGTLDFDQNGSPSAKPSQKGLYPWFECPKRKSVKPKIIFGHWATLGYRENKDAVCLDSGCVWGGKLTARRLDGADCRRVQIKC